MVQRALTLAFGFAGVAQVEQATIVSAIDINKKGNEIRAIFGGLFELNFTAFEKKRPVYVLSAFRSYRQLGLIA